MISPLRKSHARPAPRPRAEVARATIAEGFGWSSVDNRRSALISGVDGRKLQRTGLAPAAAFHTRRPMAIGILALGGQGGSGNMGQVCARALREVGHHPVLLTSPDAFYRQVPGSLEMEGLSVPESPRAPSETWEIPLAKEIAACVERRGLELVMVHYAAGLLGATLLAREICRARGSDFTVSVTLHGTDVSTWGRDPDVGPELRAQLLACDRVSAVSQWLAEEARRIFDLPWSPEVIPNSVDTAEFNPASWAVPAQTIGAGRDLRRQLAPNGEVLLVHVSNLRPVKRPLDVIQAFAAIRRAGVPARLVLIGEGPMLEKIHDFAQSLGVAEEIIPMGAVQPGELSRCLAACDLSLVASESESFCLAALESMACGVPVVGTRCGGLEEVMSEVDSNPAGQSHLLVPVGDWRALAQVSLSLLADPDWYRRAQLDSLRAPFERYPRNLQDLGYALLAEDLGASRASR